LRLPGPDSRPKGTRRKEMIVKVDKCEAEQRGTVAVGEFSGIGIVK
jgi:hypothetical protein